jgi:uncharacterized protein (DUF362 family)
MKRRHATRRQFLVHGGRLALGAAGLGASGLLAGACAGTRTRGAAQAANAGRDVVSLVRIRKGRIARAVEEAIDLLGGVETVARGKERVLLKPNLVSDQVTATTSPKVVEALAVLFQRAGKDVSVGEGSAAAGGFNVVGWEVFRTRKASLLEPMQRHVFDRLGYAELGKRLGVPLVNLHVGELATVKVPGGLAYEELQLHRALVDTDLLVSVPMMKTHGLARVTLGMKNLVGLFPGTVYGTVRAGVHDHAADRGSPGVAWEILDMVRANKVGLVVVDGSTAMEGNGPTDGTLLDMDLIVAGTNPLATDMVAAAAMGFGTEEVPTFTCAHAIGMTPTSLDQIELRGARLADVRVRFATPHVNTWDQVRRFWATKEL